MQGRLKSFSVETTQGIWAIEVSSITGAGSIHLPMLLDSHNHQHDLSWILGLILIYHKTAILTDKLCVASVLVTLFPYAFSFRSYISPSL